MMISKKTGIVESIRSENSQIQDLTVVVDGQKSRAYNYVQITGRAEVGDHLILNTTAVELSLGTGGFHFTVADLDKPESEFTRGGHIMKLRYTPIQIKVDSVEAQESIYHDVFEKFESLENMPVVVGALHSILPSFAATYKKYNPDSRLVYIMSDSAALPISFSKNVSSLKEKKLIDATITYGNGFGGDYECINIYTALITAKEIAKADCCIVAMGPGIAGTGTKYGFSGVDQANILDAVERLGGKSFIIPRISFADKRDRHRGISHHTITILKDLMFSSTNIVINAGYSEEYISLIKRQIHENNIDEKHSVVYMNYDSSKEDLERNSLKVSSMGRSYDEDSEFFIAASTVAKAVTEEVF